MRFICSRQALQAAVSSCNHAVPNRSTIPLLEGIYMRSEEDHLILTGYNMETGIRATVDADIQDEGQIVIDADLLNNVLRSLSDDIVSFDIGEDLVAVIQSGNSEFKLKGLDGDAYPKLPLEDPSERVHLPQGLLSEMIGQTIFAASQDQQRPLFNAVLLHSTPELLEMVAIDGYRLAVRREEAPEDRPFPELEYLIPSASLREVSRLMKGSPKRSGDEDGEEAREPEVALYTTKNHIVFEMDDVALISRLMQGEFMNYEQVIPEHSLSEITLDRRALLGGVERALLMTPDQERRYPVNMELTAPDTLTLSAHTELGNSHDEIPVSHQGDPIDIDFNPRYFVEALRVIDDEMVRVEFHGGSGPCLIRPVEGDAYIFLILPLRR